MSKNFAKTVFFLFLACGLFVIHLEGAPKRKPAQATTKPTLQKPATAPTGEKVQGRTPSATTTEGSSRLESMKGSRTQGSAYESLKGKMPKPSAEQQANIKNLQTDLKALAGSAQAKDEVQKLATDLSAAVDNPPSEVLVQDFANDLSTALSDSTLSESEMMALSKDIYAVMNSAGITTAELKTLQNDVAALLTAASASQDEVQAVVKDMQQIYADLQKP